MNVAQNVAGWLPAKVRAAVYTILGTAILLEAIWDVLPEPFEGKVLATLGALGFGMAAVNSADRTPLPPPAPKPVVENFPDEFA